MLHTLTSADLQKVAFAAFADEVSSLMSESRMRKTAVAQSLQGILGELEQEHGAEFLKQSSAEELSELIKTAFIKKLITKFPGLGMAPVAGVKALGKQAREGLRLKLMRDSAQMINTGGEFRAGMGHALLDKSIKSPIRAAVNPLGTAAEVALSSGGNMASKRLHAAGGRMAATNAAPAAVGVPLAAAKQRLGAATQRAFEGPRVGEAAVHGQQVGRGHKALTKVLPAAGEIAGPAALGAGLHLPFTGAAGAMGALGIKGGIGALGHAAPAAAEAVHHGLSQGAGLVAEHAGADMIGTMKQNILARLHRGHAARPISGLAH